MNAIIQLDHIHKTYHTGEVDVHAVRDVSMEIHRGEFVALMGASGSGKSTMMNTLGCLDRPTQGRYLLDGIDVSQLTRDELATIRNEKIGFVFQGFNLLSRTSALENVELPMMYIHKSLSSREQRERAMRALTTVGLAERADHHPNQLSGGQQQRVAIARALVNEPAMILADEPTGNLDTQTSIEIMGVFQKLNDGFGITIVMVTHELDIASYDHAQRHHAGWPDSWSGWAGRQPPPGGGGIEKAARGAGSRSTRAMKKIFVVLRVAMRALRRNKLRTILTMLGMIIGVGAVIATVSLGDGAKSQVEAQIASMGQNVVLIFSGSFTHGGVKSGWNGAGTLSVDDAVAIEREVPDVTIVSPEARQGTRVSPPATRIGPPPFKAKAKATSTSANGPSIKGRCSPPWTCAPPARWPSSAKPSPTSFTRMAP